MSITFGHAMPIPRFGLAPNNKHQNGTTSGIKPQTDKFSHNAGPGTPQQQSPPRFGMDQDKFGRILTGRGLQAKNDAANEQKQRELDAGKREAYANVLQEEYEKTQKIGQGNNGTQSGSGTQQPPKRRRDSPEGGNGGTGGNGGGAAGAATGAAGPATKKPKKSDPKFSASKKEQQDRARAARAEQRPAQRAENALIIMDRANTRRYGRDIDQLIAQREREAREREADEERQVKIKKEEEDKKPDRNGGAAGAATGTTATRFGATPREKKEDEIAKAIVRDDQKYQDQLMREEEEANKALQNLEREEAKRKDPPDDTATESKHKQRKKD